MSCERATVNEECRVVVQLPKTFSERRRGCENALGRACAPCAPIWKLLCYIFLVLFALSVFWSFWWIIILVSYCQKTPGPGLEDVSIRDMVLYQNSTTGTAWQVRSDISVNLTAWNPNTVAGCFTTYRHMVVHVFYKEHLLLQQKVSLEFKLKPKGKRPVVLELQGDGYTVEQDLGSLLQVELRNANAVELNFSFISRFLRNDHKAGWMGMCCDLVAKTPLNSSSKLNSTGGLFGRLAIPVDISPDEQTIARNHNNSWSRWRTINRFRINHVYRSTCGSQNDGANCWEVGGRA